MTTTAKIPHRLDEDGKKVPRIAIMGEFSAGKSTLCNLLMNGDTLPRKVTATQLAPVWMTQGDGGHVRVQNDGTETPIELDQLASVPLDDTRFIKLGLPQDIFGLCDLIDFPGISDPNMDPEVWSRLLEEADAVIWLTHATQAWRQTEAAVWDIVSEDVQDRSLLLLTRWDKVTSDLDRKRILARIERETIGLFKSVMPISLVDAIAAGDDVDAWTQSGAEAFMAQLIDIVTQLKTGQASTASQSTPAQDAPAARLSNVGPSEEPAVAATHISPRRVRPASNGQGRRPTATSAQ